MVRKGESEEDGEDEEEHLLVDLLRASYNYPLLVGSSSLDYTSFCFFFSEGTLHSAVPSHTSRDHASNSFAPKVVEY